MRTVSSCVTNKEHAAVVEFANQYGETVSGAIKKAIFDVAALTNEDCPSGFELNMESREGKDEYGNSLSDVLFSDNIDKYVDMICNEMIPEITKRDLAKFCDVFCEEGYFSIQHTKKIFETALKFNLKLKIHADEFILRPLAM